MGLDVWFRQDVARILASTQETLANSLGAVPPLDLEMAGAYRQGFSDALHAVAVAFGISATSGAPWAGRECVVEAVPSWTISGQDRLGSKSWQ